MTFRPKNETIFYKINNDKNDRGTIVNHFDNYTFF